MHGQSRAQGEGAGYGAAGGGGASRQLPYLPFLLLLAVAAVAAVVVARKDAHARGRHMYQVIQDAAPAPALAATRGYAEGHGGRGARPRPVVQST